MRRHHFRDGEVIVLPRELFELVDRTADPAYATGPDGVIVAWNSAAEAMFGVTRGETVGKLCADVIRGEDECGPYCTQDCAIRDSVRRRCPVRNYDIKAATSGGKRWCNFFVLPIDVAGEAYALHVTRDLDVTKRLELLVRDFVGSEFGANARTGRPPRAMHSPAENTTLSKREGEILRLVACGAGTREVAATLHISAATVNNHIQHILHKLNAHTRLQAVRRAELAGLIAEP